MQDYMGETEDIKSRDFTLLGSANKAVTCKSFGLAGQLKLPKWFLKNLFTSDREVLPKEDEEWTDFEDRIKEWNKDEVHNFPVDMNQPIVAPHFEHEEALHSYVVEEMVWANPGKKMHPELLKAMFLGVHDAHIRTTTAREGPRDDLGKDFLLGDIGTLMSNQKDGKTEWMKNYMGPMVIMPTFNKEKHSIKTIKVITTKAQKESEVEDVKIVLEQFLEKEEVIVTAVVEEVAYKPVKKHQSRTTLKTDAPAAA